MTNNMTDENTTTIIDMTDPHDDDDYLRFGPHKIEYTPKQAIAHLLDNIRLDASRMSFIYERHPELNNTIDIQNVIPMSLDEWASELCETINRIDG